MKTVTRMAKAELENLGTRRAFIKGRKKLVDRGYYSEHDADYVIVIGKVEAAENALDSLTERERELLIDRYVNPEHTPREEFALRWGMSVTKVNGMISDALEKFAQIYFGTEEVERWQEIKKTFETILR